MPKPLDELLNELLPSRTESVPETPTSSSSFGPLMGAHQADIQYVNREGLSRVVGLPAELGEVVNEEVDSFFGIPPSAYRDPKTPLSEDEETFLKFQKMSRGETGGFLDKGIGTAAMAGGQMARILTRVAYLGTRVTSGIASRVVHPEGAVPEGESKGFTEDLSRVAREEGMGLLNMITDAIPQIMLAGPDFVGQSLGAKATSPGRAISDMEEFLDGPVFAGYKYLYEKAGGTPRTREEWKNYWIGKAGEAYQAPEIPYFGLHMGGAAGKFIAKKGKQAGGKVGRFVAEEAREAQRISADPLNTEGQLTYQLERADATRRLVQNERVMQGQEQLLAGMSPEANVAARRHFGPELDPKPTGRSQLEGGQPLGKLKTAEERASGKLAEDPVLLKSLDKLTGQEGSPTKSAKRSAQAFKKTMGIDRPKPLTVAEKAADALKLKNDLKAKEKKQQAKRISVTERLTGKKPKDIVDEIPKSKEKQAVPEQAKVPDRPKTEPPTTQPKPSVAVSDKAGKVKPDDYASEADFVKAHGSPMYHGTAADFEKFDVGLSGSVAKSDWGPGIYLESSKSGADSYRINAIKSKSKAYNDAYDEYQEIVKKLPPVSDVNSTPAYTKKSDMALKRFQEIGRQLDADKNSGRIVKVYIEPGAKTYKHNTTSGMTDPYLSEHLRSKGYDVLIVDEGKMIGETVILNPNVIKTHKQIIGQWKKAHPKKTTVPPTVKKSLTVEPKVSKTDIAKGGALGIAATALALSDDDAKVAGVLGLFGGKGKRGKKKPLSVADIAKIDLRPKKTGIVKRETSTRPIKSAIPAPVVPRVNYTGSTEKPAERIGLSKAQTEGLREELGLSKIPEAEKQTFVEWAEQAKAGGHDQNAMSVAKSMNEVKSGTFSNYAGLSVTEQMGMGMKRAELKKEYNRRAKMVDEFIERNDVRGVEKNRPALEQILEEIDLIDRALVRGRREVARALGVGRAVFDVETMDLASITSRAQRTKGARLTPEEKAVMSGVSKAGLEKETKFDKAQAEWDADVEVREKARAESIIRAQKALEQEAGKRTASKAKEIKSREDIVARLNELGFRANSITGLPVEVALLVGKLAFSHIKDGARGLNEVTKRTIKDVPDITPRDVRQALLASDPKVQKKARTEVAKTKSHILRQTRLLDKIEKAEQGIFNAPKKRAPTPADIKSLMNQLKKLRDNAYETIADPARLQQAIHNITLLREQLDGQYRNLKKKQRATPAEIESYRNEAKVLRKQMRMEDTLADLNEQLRTGEFKIPEKQMVPELPVHLQRLQVDVVIARRNVRMAIEELSPWTFGRGVKEGTGFLRTMKATADMSGVLRQGFLLTAMRPGVAVSSFGRAAKSMFSEHSAETYNQGIINAPHHYLREGARLFLSDLRGKLNAKEEHFASSWAEKIPVWGKVVKGSERHMTTYLNLLRVAAFDQFLAKHPNATPAELRGWADFINKASGRGDFGKYAGVGDLLALGFFAPKFALSRIQAPLALVGKKQRGLPRVQKAIAKELVATTALGVTTLTLAHFAGLEVGLDPDESDWGKIRFGDTRVDIFAGIQQPTRATYRVMRSALDATGLTDNVLRRDEDPYDIIEQFAEFKAAPVVSAIHSLITGKSAVGEDRTPWEVLYRSGVPIVVEGIIDEALEWDSPLSVPKVNTKALKDPETYAGPALDFFGIGANQYEDRISRARRDINNAIVDGDRVEAYKILWEWNIKHPHKGERISSDWVKKQFAKFRKGKS